MPTQFTRTDVVVVAIVLVVIGCTIFPALAQSHSDASQSKCLNNLKQLALALLNCQDTRKYFPLASTKPLEHKPGSADDASGAGFSWLAMATPFMEQGKLYDSLAPSIKENKPAFNPSMTASDGTKALHPSAVVINDLICPSFKRDPHVAADGSDYKPANDGSLPALTNYNALAGSHFFNADGIGRMLPPERIQQGFAYEGDGAMPFPGIVSGRLQKYGLQIQTITDGTSNTAAIAETIEPAFSAWIDGQVTWLVAAWPGNKVIPTLQKSTINPTLQVLSWSDDEKKSNKVAVNLRNSDGSPIVYLAAGRWSGSKERKFAASSNHPGVVGHGYLDGHVDMISNDVDPNVYLALVTRAGRDIIPDDFKKKVSANSVRPTEQDFEPLRPRPTARRTAVQVRPEQWTSTVDWSPLAIGDLQLTFPDLVVLAGAGSDASFASSNDRGIVRTFKGKSAVFSSFNYDDTLKRFELRVASAESDKAPARLYKQLREAFGDPTSKEINGRPKRVSWRKDMKWGDEMVSLQFDLKEAADTQPARITISVLPK